MNLNRADKAFGCFTIVLIIVWAAIWATVLYVAYHFLMKVW